MTDAPCETQIAHDSDRTPVIELEDVSVAFGDKRVLDGLSLSIEPRTTTVIIGRSGSGKTVLLKTMLGLVHPDRGRVRLLGRDVSTVSEPELVELRRHASMLFQSYALFDGMSVEDNVEFPMNEGPRSSRTDAEHRAHELIHLLGLDGNEGLLPGELSGGMKKRVGLARALITRPDLVLFDEPTTGLDPLMVERVDGLIELARKEYGITAVIISHDLASVRRLADRVAFLHEGKIIFEGTYDELVDSQLAPVREFLDVARVPRIEQGAPEPAAPIIRMIDVHRSFGDKQVLRGVDLAIQPRSITVLIGASGSGKSVIAKHLLGLLKPDRGQIEVFGRDIVPLTERQMIGVRVRFGLVFQHAGLLDWLSVEDNVAFPLAEHGHRSRQHIRERVAPVLDQLGLTELAARMPSELSVGERKRVALARAMVSRPDVVIYDEPTTGQDPLRAFEIDNLILHAQERFGITSLVISHDLTSAFRIAHHIAMLHDGKIAAYGTPAELRASRDPYVQRFLRAAGV